MLAILDTLALSSQLIYFIHLPGMGFSQAMLFLISANLLLIRDIEGYQEKNAPASSSRNLMLIRWDILGIFSENVTKENETKVTLVYSFSGFLAYFDLFFCNKIFGSLYWRLLCFCVMVCERPR